ncbi:MAG: LuxR family transcriptional regulator [Sphingobacteriaceae bacterium]|nr:MAG: LuxR family transcriptional regulator [Sphingobacteriaceae bacterium]
MGLKAYTQIEKKLQCQSAIFNLGNSIKKGRLLIEDIGDYIPGNVMVQDLASLQNTYMNSSGCEILRHSNEELALLGPEYFSKFFPPEEIVTIKSELFKFLHQHDDSKVYSFFQRVRPNSETPYKWYLTSTKIHPNVDSNNCLQLMHVSIEVGDTCYATKKMNYLCQQNDFVQKNFVRYDTLTCREKEIISMIAHGESSYVISDKLYISQHTVNNHRKNILRKLEIKSLTSLIKFAIAFDML